MVKIEKISKVILFWIVAFIAILTAVNYFSPGLGTLQYIAPVLVLGIAFFVFAEVGMFKGLKAKDPFRVFGAIIALVAILSVILEFIGITFAVLDTIKGLLSILLAIYFIVEGLR